MKPAEKDDGLEHWTVVGYYTDNRQPWVEFALGNTPQEAVADAISKVQESADNLVIVEVFKGNHQGQLCAEYLK